MILRAVRLAMQQTVRPMRSGKFTSLTFAGFTYIGVLAILSVMMIAMGAVAQIWHTQMQRENEQELLFIGHEFRAAIGRYQQESGRGFPTSLQVLLGTDGDVKLNKRYLRRIYRDPFTGENTWGLVLANDGQIAGVYSLSDMKPYKQAEFAERDSTFEGKTKYSEWQFVYTPQKAKAGTASGGNTVNGIPRPIPRIGESPDQVNGTNANNARPNSPNNNSPTTVSRARR